MLERGVADCAGFKPIRLNKIMMNKVLKLLLLFIFSKTFSQDLQDSKPNNLKSKDSIYVIENKLTAYPTGISGFRHKFYTTFDVEKVKGKGKAKSEVTFLVTTEGNLINIKASGINDTMNREMERTIEEMSHIKWIPAKVNGKAVDFVYKFPAELSFEQ